MTPYIAEFVGTALLLLLGDGVVANVILKGTKGEGAGWITITWGWGMAVFVAVFVTAAYSGAHINPAVTIGLAVAGKFAWAMVPGYIVAQVLGAMAGVFLSKAIVKYDLDSEAFERVRGAVVRLSGLAVVLLIGAAALETWLAPWMAAFLLH